MMNGSKKIAPDFLGGGSNPDGPVSFSFEQSILLAKAVERGDTGGEGGS
jgi:hypothetical protein